jgi:flagellar biosynthesis/type III secretory pathway M-ring protein FliF/YscJ
MEEGKKKIVTQVVLFIVVFAIAFFGTKYVMSNLNSSNPELGKAVAEMNKQCPQVIDADTRLDSTSTFEDTFQYHYSLVNFSKEDSKLDVENVKKTIQKLAQENFDINPAMKNFREKQVSLKYTYKDKTGKYLFDFTIKANNK